MFTNVLCPIDFTTFSHHALERAVGIARAYGAAVTGLHVVDGSPSAAADGPAEDLAGLQAQVLKALQEVNAPSPRAVVVTGDPATEIIKLAGALPAALVVMASHGRTGCADGTCGSVTHQVLCHAPVPVIAVPEPSGQPAPESTGGFQRIACGIDFSPASLKALRCAGELAGLSPAQLLVTHVLATQEAPVNSASLAGSLNSESSVAHWQRRLSAAAHSHLPAGFAVEDHLRVGDPGDELLQLAIDQRCDLIAIGGHRGNPQGCVMNRVVTRSTCPVLTVRVAR